MSAASAGTTDAAVAAQAETHQRVQHETHAVMQSMAARFQQWLWMRLRVFYFKGIYSESSISNTSIKLYCCASQHDRTHHQFYLGTKVVQRTYSARSLQFRFVSPRVFGSGGVLLSSLDGNACSTTERRCRSGHQSLLEYESRTARQKWPSMQSAVLHRIGANIHCERTTCGL